MNLSDNTILITGGGSGIGRGLAQRFHDLGNTVIVAGRTRASLEETIAERARMHAAIVDVSDADSIRTLSANITRAYPGLNMLINNAGMMR